MEHSQAILKATGGERSVSANREQVRATHLDMHPMLRLQSAIGNRAVQRLIEAGLEGTDAQESPVRELLAGELVNEVLSTPGHALDSTTRAVMESSFGVDFSAVRIHSDGRAGESADAVHAHAYTSGQDVVFAEGRYAPGSAEGQRLLAHELTHVVQQAAGPVAGTPIGDGSLSVSDPDDGFEQEADFHAERVVESASGDAAAESAGGATATAPVTVQRDDDDDDEGFFGKIGSAVSSGVSSVASGVSDVAGDAWQGAKNVASDVGDVAGDAWQGAKNVASDVGDVAGDAWQGAKNVASDVGDVAGDAWKGAKNVAGDVADFGGEVYGQMKEDAGYIRKGAGYVNKGIDWLEDEAKGGTHWVADKAKGIPVLEQMADVGEAVTDTAIDFEGGLAKGATGLAGGLLSAAADPVDTAKGLYTMSEHIPGLGLPEKALHGAYDLAFSDKSAGQVADETFNPMADAKYWGGVGKGIWSPLQQSIDAGKPGEAIGQGAFDVGMLLTGAGEAGAAVEGAGVAGELAEGADVAALAEGADAAKGAEVAEGAGSLGEAAEPVQIPVDPKAPGFPEAPAPASEMEGASASEVDTAGGGASRSGPPADDYDVAAWEKYYQENPGAGRSAGAAANNELESAAAEESLPSSEVPETTAPQETGGPGEVENGGGGEGGSPNSPDVEQMADEVQAGRNARLRAQSPYRENALARLREEVESGIRSPDTEMLAQDRGANVPVEIAEGETTLGEAQANVHHIQALNEAPELAASEENSEILDAQGRGSAHKAGAHGNDFGAPRNGVPANPEFDKNLGMSGDMRRVTDSGTGRTVPRLGESPEKNLTVEEQGNITARPREQSLEDILNDEARSPEDEWNDRIDSSTEPDDEFEDD
jgi:hypothetical protein